MNIIDILETNIEKGLKKSRRNTILVIVLAVLLLVGAVAGHILLNRYLDREKKVILFTDYGFRREGYTYITKARNLQDFLDEIGYRFEVGKDKIDCNLIENLKDETKVEVQKYLKVTLKDGEDEKTVNAFDLDVEGLASLLGLDVKDGIVTGGNGTVFPEGESSISDFEISYEKEVSEVPYELVWVEDKTFPIGDTYVICDGVTGLNDDIYLVLKKDGVETGRVLVKRTVTRKKVDLQKGYGMKVNWGLPEGFKYKAVLDDVTAVSYTYAGTPYGVYGLWCSYGTAAIDRSLIPLGSLLYIPGYGYAIANDVGSAIHGHSIDLYMERWIQCSHWGNRKTQIYIVEYGDDTTNWSRYKRDESLKYYDENGVFRRKEQ
ncbi:MAG: 3D domain-containing protein [Clostridia bacterium]|nr:3D domain-containing protein [Clostridia bacterium]